ncbi:MAG TPA: hypothetical protein VME18_09525 [Acidobacteriaceae bacterium]|nr:hypothetical protein [Acidobacteriaceae bacterium]
MPTAVFWDISSCSAPAARTTPSRRRLALSRTRSGELLAPALTGGPAPMYLLSTVSALESLLEAPMHRILESLPPRAEMKSALAGDGSPAAGTLELVRSLEACDWNECQQIQRRLGLCENAIAANYVESLRWASTMIKALAAPQKAPRYTACVPKPRISFPVLLPLLSLTLWLVLVPTQTGYVYFRLVQLSHGSTQMELGSGDFTIFVPRNRFLVWSLNGIAMREAPLIEAIDIPGTLGDILISLPTTWPDTWCPANLSFDAWRFLSWPLFCLPAWWFVGRGLDTLLGWRRPRWWTLLAGSLLSTGFLILLFGIRFVESAQERASDTWIWFGLALWTLLFATFPAAWLRRTFARKPAPGETPADLAVS